MPKVFLLNLVISLMKNDLTVSHLIGVDIFGIGSDSASSKYTNACNAWIAKSRVWE